MTCQQEKIRETARAGIPLFVALLLLIQIQLNSSKSCAQSCFVGLTAYGVRFVLL